MYKIYRLFIILFFFSFCTSYKVLRKSNHNSKINDNELFVKMQRTACYGTCPQYTISIYANGLIQYNGKAFVDKINCFQTMLDQHLILEIQTQLKDVNFFSFKNEYLSPITDIPSVILEVYEKNYGRHVVIDRLNGPEELKNTHNLIDSIANSIKEWQACDTLN